METQGLYESNNKPDKNQENSGEIKYNDKNFRDTLARVEKYENDDKSLAAYLTGDYGELKSNLEFLQFEFETTAGQLELIASMPDNNNLEEYEKQLHKYIASSWEKIQNLGPEDIDEIKNQITQLYHNIENLNKDLTKLANQSVTMAV